MALHHFGDAHQKVDGQGNPCQLSACGHAYGQRSCGKAENMFPRSHFGSSLGSSSSVARVGSALCRTGSGSNAVSTGLNSGIPASALNLLPWSKLSSPSGKRSVTYPRLRAVVLLASSRGHQAEVVGACNKLGRRAVGCSVFCGGFLSREP